VGLIVADAIAEIPNPKSHNPNPKAAPTKLGFRIWDLGFGI